MAEGKRPEQMLVDDTGHRLANVSFLVTGDREHTIMTFGVVDRSSRTPLPSPRFFTDYQGLGLLITTLLSAARKSLDGLIKSGTSEALTAALRRVMVTHLQSGAVGISTDRTAVSMEIQTIEGHLVSYALDPDTARKLARSLLDAADQLKPPSALN
jgi:hypothetical protein